MTKEYGKQIQDYELLEILGEGSFGCVQKAVDNHTGDIVAIKELKDLDFDCTSWKACLNIREVKALRDLDHPNIIRLKQIIMENYILYLVMECMDMTLTQLMKNKVRKSSNNDQVRGVTIQLFEALAHMHKKGYFHRDLKPDNILVSNDVVKVADFGMAREVSMDGDKLYTGRVTTLWYRAPEVLVKPSLYGPAVDMWAMGAIMAELFTSTPLFRGSNEVDQVWKICSVIGTPTKETWEEGLSRAGKIFHHVFPRKYDGVDKLAELMPNADEDAISLIRWLCSWDDRKRPTALEALQHPFFASQYSIPKSIEITKETTEITKESINIRFLGVKDSLRSSLARYFLEFWELVKRVACNGSMRKKCIN
ncbi:hypothetical protein Sjap_004484 [Stephania japonica]|uniref:Protein kinase domain-containing protein n=1 Tax=Stephania japonica TaxID=461633 RepID=A0AAP0PKY7_9MAGN